ncbi:MAG: 4-(cytidine 5'-diphospho)-2-C-methyl-D-erythritol kinase [Candidatus Atribacteria bacterium]|nr:4-(cytidine 5'-diphospho)-2-C-methyl-D-erythritol kinase [Candidatus Atribacteria bacterium]
MPDIHVVRSYGKINWFLSIGSLRKDGYHEICSLMQKISLYDEIEMSIAPSDSITCNYSVPVGEESLLGRTLVTLRELYPLLSKVGLAIKIRKFIPPGSGLGGGSSNVATLLHYIPTLLGLSSVREKVLNIAPTLGSDVPFFLYKTPFALVRGRGEDVVPLYPSPGRFIVLLFPSFPISTAWAYRKWDEEVGNLEALAREGRKALHRFLENGNKEMIEKAIWNDFELLMFRYHPVLKVYRRMLLELGCRKVFMTGSGSTLVGVVENREQGEKIVEELSQKGINIILTSTLVEEM